MQFQKVFYRYDTTPDVSATVAMGADSDPRSVYGTPGTAPKLQTPGMAPGANVDNVLQCRTSSSSTASPVERIAVVMCGPNGATSPTGNLYVWDGSTQHWYLVNAAPVMLPQNQVVYFDALAPCEAPPGSNAGVSQQGADYMIVVTKNVAPTAGQYSFAMSAVLGTP
jgi:hypothetical protein